MDSLRPLFMNALSCVLPVVALTFTVAESAGLKEETHLPQGALFVRGNLGGDETIAIVFNASGSISIGHVGYHYSGLETSFLDSRSICSKAEIIMDPDTEKVSWSTSSRGFENYSFACPTLPLFWKPYLQKACSLGEAAVRVMPTDSGAGYARSLRVDAFLKKQCVGIQTHQIYVQNISWGVDLGLDL